MQGAMKQMVLIKYTGPLICFFGKENDFSSIYTIVYDLMADIAAEWNREFADIFSEGDWHLKNDV